jgi:hypothetical protein
MKSFELLYKNKSPDGHSNALTLSREFNWVSQFISNQMNIYFQNGKETPTSSPSDLLTDRSTYAEFIKYYNFSIEERIVLLIAMAPHVCPQLLDCFFIKNATYNRSFTEFGGVKGSIHNGFLPTAETAVFILSLNDLMQRFRLVTFFSSDHYFYKHKIISLEKENSSEPHLSGKLVISKEFLSLLTEDEIYNPAYSSEFPAAKLETKLSWEDLILEETTREQVIEIEDWIKLEQKIMSNNDLSKFIKPGYRSLFYGPPGTGKTLTASLIGRYTGLTVYRIDLSKVVSKYIGETEKNLARIFDQGENKNWILFFDEADALFGKRTSTSDSKDRYANQEIAYLLQRMEEYSGVIILATNLKTNMDEAFSRRFQSMIYFPMPKLEQRLQLWNAMFKGLELDTDVNLRKIAQSYELAGGAIINVLRYCALQSLSRKEQMVYYDDIILGIQKELFKEGKTL